MISMQDLRIQPSAKLGPEPSRADRTQAILGWLRSGRQPLSMDLDDTMFDTLGSMLRVINTENRTSFTARDVTSYTWDRVLDALNRSKDIDYLIYVHGLAIKDHEHLIPLVSEVELLSLAQHYDVTVVTSMPEAALRNAMTYVSYNSPNFKAPVLNIGADDDKAELPFRFYIDDKPDLAASMNRLDDKLLYLVRYRYNLHIKECGSVIPVGSTPAAIRDLVKLARCAKESSITVKS